MTKYELERITQFHGIDGRWIYYKFKCEEDVSSKLTDENVGLYDKIQYKNRILIRLAYPDSIYQLWTINPCTDFVSTEWLDKHWRKI